MELEIEKRKNKNLKHSKERIAYAARVAVEIEDDRISFLRRSNFDQVFDDYVNLVSSQCTKIRKIVEEDVVVEDLIFED
jgi:hypothetical protein